jgi:hypothetical protein
MFLKKDNLRLGLVLGLIGPVIGLIIIYYLMFPSYSFREFLDAVQSEKRLIAKIGSLSLLVNAISFFIYINTHKDYTAKGIFIITLIYGVGILLVKLI